MPTVTILGCGGSAGVPQIGGPDGHGDWGAADPAEPRNRRTRSSIVVAGRGAGQGGGEGGRFLVDTGPDLRQQMLACGIRTVDAVLFTHAHADHVLGIDDVRIINRMAGPLPAYATERTLAELRGRFDYAFKPWEPPNFFRPVLVPHPVAYGTRIEVAGMPVDIFQQDHGFLPTLGFRTGRFGYSTDVVTLDAAALATLEGIDTWVVDCFQRRPHITHANLDQVIAWNARIRARHVVFTHMGHDIDYAWLAAASPDGYEPGYDGMVLTIPD